MRHRFAIIFCCGSIGGAMTGCSEPPPPPAVPTESPEKLKAEELKKLEGTWLLKSSLVASGPGTYSLNPTQGAELVFRISDGVMDMRVGDNPWMKHATLEIGDEPQCLLSSRPDASGQVRVLKLRYKLEGNTFVTVQDNLYNDILPDSFNIESGVERQRQINTYVKSNN
jgi:hypothetical protein